MVFWNAVLATVEFDREFGFFTEEIECVRPGGMLPAEFVVGEASVAKPFPEQSFGPAGGLTQAAGADDFSGGHLREWTVAKYGENEKRLGIRLAGGWRAPHPGPLPEERGRVGGDVFDGRCFRE